MRNITKLVVKNNRYVIEDHSTSFSVDESNKSPLRPSDYKKKENIQRPAPSKKVEVETGFHEDYANGPSNKASKRDSLGNSQEV
jgi:hypothetical protein